MAPSDFVEVLPVVLTSRVCLGKNKSYGTNDVRNPSKTYAPPCRERTHTRVEQSSTNEKDDDLNNKLHILHWQSIRIIALRENNEHGMHGRAQLTDMTARAQ